MNASEQQHYATVSQAAETVGNTAADSTSFAVPAVLGNAHGASVRASAPADPRRFAHQHRHHLASRTADKQQEHEAQQKKKAKKKQRKAPAAPTRPRSAYLFFSMEQRPKIKQEMGDSVHVTEIMKRCAELWKEVAPEERTRFHNLAEHDRLRYEAEISAYTGPMHVPNKRRRKDPSAPKRGTSAFLLWSQQLRPQLREKYPHLKNVEVSKLLGQRWQQLSVQDKAPFEQAARDDYERYRVELERWREDHGDSAAIFDAAGIHLLSDGLVVHAEHNLNLEGYTTNDNSLNGAVVTMNEDGAHQRTDHDRTNL